MSPFAGKIIFLNAPPGAGKDTIAMTMRELYDVNIMSFKTPMFAIASAMVGLDMDTFMMNYHDREKKENPSDVFLGMSARELLIAISEEFCKPKFGSDYFGVVAARAMNSHTLKHDGYVFSDCGFDEEVVPIANKFGKENCIVIQFTGQGRYNFAGDSRNWLSEDSHGIQTICLDCPNQDCTAEDFVAYLIDQMKTGMRASR